jgi:hypothetical protein
VQFTQVVPADVDAETRDAVAAFVDVFAGRRDCVGGAQLELVDDVDGGDARYRPEDATIEVAIPTSPRRYRESLVHELAHHVERACPDFADAESAILAAIGDPDRPWASSAMPWEERPAEIWAESVVQLVLGERVRFARTMPLDPAVVDAARSWIGR